MLFSRLGSVLRIYGSRLRAFRPNARLFLASVAMTGMALGVYQLLFNFYVLSLGYDKTLLGSLLTTSSLSALILAIPMGYLADRVGRKFALLGGLGLEAISIAVMALWPSTPLFYAMCILLGTGQALNGVTFGPFLMENSGEEERTYLFSLSSGFMTASGSLGNWLGGLLPTWIALSLGAEPTSSQAYGSALILVAFGAGLATIPILFMRSRRTAVEDRSVFAPFSYLAKHPGLLGRLVLPMLITSIGAGLVMPFMNVFFRDVHGQPDPVIGSLFAWGSLAMGIGLIIAPPLAERVGKIRLVVITQGLSIPFLILLGFAPWYWLSASSYYTRLALMNMSGPVYQTFVMEKVEASARGMVASLVSMASNFGWAFSPGISGWIQERWGFGPAFMLTIGLYSVSVLLYWGFFGGGGSTRRRGDREEKISNAYPE